MHQGYVLVLSYLRRLGLLGVMENVLKEDLKESEMSLVYAHQV